MGYPREVKKGIVVRPFSGGYEEKGGVNSSTSKVVLRPAAPASMKPPVYSSSGASKKSGTSGRK